jgi:hypothetical protein
MSEGKKLFALSTVCSTFYPSQRQQAVLKARSRGEVRLAVHFGSQERLTTQSRAAFLRLTPKP